MVMRGRCRKLTAAERSLRLKENTSSLWLIIFSLWKISKHGIYLTCAPCAGLSFQILFFKTAIKIPGTGKKMLLEHSEAGRERGTA